MSNFLDRVAAKALAPAGNHAVGPRFDAGVERAGQTSGNAIEVELGAVVGDQQSDPAAAAIGSRHEFTPPSALAAAQPRGEIVTVAPLVFEKDAASVGNAAPRSAQRPDGELRSHDRPIGTPTLDWKIPSVARQEPPVTQAIHEPAMDRTARHTARADPALTLRPVMPPAPVVSRPDAANPIPVRFAPARRDSAQSFGSPPVLPRQREHPTHIAPRAAGAGAAFRETAVPNPMTSRGYAPTPSPDASREPPTVHVTIGRLEIRAPQPAPVTGPRQAAAPPSRRLEAYLEKRASRGRR